MNVWRPILLQEPTGTLRIESFTKFGLPDIYALISRKGQLIASPVAWEHRW